MTDQFVAEIRVFGFNFAPNGWAQCNGQIMSISQNTALFSLLGTTYGGNGTTTFALPNLQGSAACSSGQGTALSDRFLGEQFGEPTVTLQTSQIPIHNHNFLTLSVKTGAQVANGPSANSHLSRTLDQHDYSNAAANTTLAPGMAGAAGSGQSHENHQPFLAMNFCIALTGIFPPRS